MGDDIFYELPITRKTYWFTSSFLKQVDADFAEVRKANPGLIFRRSAVIEAAYSISREQAIEELKNRGRKNT